MSAKVRVWSFGIVILLVGALVAACGADDPPAPTPTPGVTPSPGNGELEDWEVEWEETVRAAEQEGRVVVTVFNDPQRRTVLEFGNAFPAIEVEVQILPGREFVARVPAEMEAGIYDFDVYMSGSTTAATQLLPMGHVFEDTRSLLFLPEVIDDEMWVGGNSGDYWADVDTQRHIPNNQASATGNNFWVNRDVAPDVQTIEDWLDPQFQGRVCLEDPRTIGGGDTFWTMVHIFYGEDFVREMLTETQPRITRDLRQLAADTVRGDCAITIGGDFTTFQQEGVIGHLEQVSLALEEISEEMRDRVHVICCGEGKLKDTIDGQLSGGIGGPAVLQNSPHPNAAKLFVNWYLSREGQEAWLAQQTTVERDEGTFANDCVGASMCSTSVIPSSGRSRMVPTSASSGPQISRFVIRPARSPKISWADRS